MKDLSKLHFPGKEPDETVLIALRRHAMAIMKRIFIFVILGIIPIVIYILVRLRTDWLNDNSSFLYMIAVLLASIFYLYILLFIYHAWVDYYLDIWIVTNERVISIEHKGLFHRTVSELRLDKIQDVSSEMKGFLPIIFRYGDLSVQTASETDKFNFHEVPHPEAIARQILQLHEQYLASHPGLTQAPSTETPETPQNISQNQTNENKTF